MKLKNLQIRNHPLFNDLKLDFTTLQGEIIDTIIIAGENGTGKSTLFNLIYNFFILELRDEYEHYMKCTVELSSIECQSLQTGNRFSEQFKQMQDSTLFIERDYSIKGNWNQIQYSFIGKNNEFQTLNGNLFPKIDTQTFRVLYSDTEVNFTPQSISSVTAKDVDQNNQALQRSSQNLATDIAQLLIDIQALDDADFAEWGRSNISKPVDSSVIDSRIGRFKNAFAFMFPNKQYKKVMNHQNAKKVVFESNGKEIFLENLSSGEKQIVFRGGFLLQNQGKNSGAIILIDEPEISLHPGWQLKILEFYKKLFTVPTGEQVCQLLIATHSPFVIHNDNRVNDKVIVLKLDNKGDIVTDESPTFHGWSSQKIIEHAFNLSSLIPSSNDPLIITEGKTDAAILRVAWSKLYPTIPMPFEILASGIEVAEMERSGNADQVRRTLELLANIIDNRLVIGVFDNDREGNEQFKGLNGKTFERHDVVKILRKHQTKSIYGLLLPIPSNREKFCAKHRIDQRYFVIEHYFRDEVLKSHNLEGEHILDSCVFEISGDKTTFANTIQSLDKGEFEAFRLLFDQIMLLRS